MRLSESTGIVMNAQLRRTQTALASTIEPELPRRLVMHPSRIFHGLHGMYFKLKLVTL